MAQFSNPLSSPTEPRLGNPVVATDDVPTEGITTVRTGSAGQGSPQLPQVIGLLIEVGAVGQDGGTVTVQSSGEVTLTAAQWDLITDGSGGLTQGAIYYLDPTLDLFGRLTTTFPTTSGTAIAQVGVALSATTMLLSLPAVPVIVPGT